MNEHVSDEPRGDRKRFPLRAMLIGFLAIVSLLALWAWLTPPAKVSSRLVSCANNLRQLAICLALYVDDHHHRYPPADRWCDALVSAGYAHATDEVFHCPKVSGGPCDYAMNPHASPRSAPDVVLLFESKPGWNQSGGPKLLTTENHPGKGCTVLFTDHSVRFVEAQEVAAVNWGQADESK